jgi:uncharacterized protein
MPNPRFEAPSWDEIYEMLVDTAAKIRKSNYSPDVIVGVSRGGWPPARIMSDLLENQNLANMKVVFYRDIGVRNKAPVITQPVTTDVSGRRVLVVDDVADTGHSLKVVVNHLKKKGARQIKVCTLYFKPRSVFTPDFYVKRTTKWVIFPWERLEALSLISKKLRPSQDNPSALVRTLKGSGLTPKLIKQLSGLKLASGKN